MFNKGPCPAEDVDEFGCINIDRKELEPRTTKHFCIRGLQHVDTWGPHLHGLQHVDTQVVSYLRGLQHVHAWGLHLRGPQHVDAWGPLFSVASVGTRAPSPAEPHHVVGRLPMHPGRTGMTQLSTAPA